MKSKTRTRAKKPRSGTTDGRSRLQQRFADADSANLLSASRRAFLRALIDNPSDIYFLSSRELARRFGMDTATVVRTVQALGYRKFADFSADLREHFVMRITPYRLMKTAAAAGRSPGDHVASSIEKDMENLMELRAHIDIRRVLNAARRILRAGRVLVVGLDFAASLAWYLEYHLTVFGIRAEAPAGTSGSLQHKVRTLNRKDLLIAISFGRCLRPTVEAAIEARSKGVPTLAITDSEFSPLARNCDECLLVSIANPSLAGSYAAAVSLLSSLLVACAHIAPERSLDMLRRIETDRHNSERWFE